MLPVTIIKTIIKKNKKNEAAGFNYVQNKCNVNHTMSLSG